MPDADWSAEMVAVSAAEVVSSMFLGLGLDDALDLEIGWWANLSENARVPRDAIEEHVREEIGWALSAAGLQRSGCPENDLELLEADDRDEVLKAALRSILAPEQRLT